MTNVEYLNALPEIANKYKVNLQDGEKVVFNAIMPAFGPTTGGFLGTDSKFTLTNKKMVFNNGRGVWTIELEKITKCIRIERIELKFFKNVFFEVYFDGVIIYNDGKDKLSGIQFGFKKKVMPQFEEIVRNAFSYTF